MTALRSALIVAHGHPSNPAAAEAGFAAFGRDVAARLPGWRIASATLAAPGALEATLAVTGPRPLVYPHFIAQGWFTRAHLPARLAAAGAEAAAILAPFGDDPAARSLAAHLLREAASARGWDEATTTVVLAAHGSRSGAPEPAAAVAGFAAALARATGFRDIRPGFLEEPPFLRDAARDAGPRALCLPVFIARWGHVEDDLPDALGAAGFSGPTLGPLGSDPGAVAVVAAALARAADPAGPPS